MGQGPDAPLCHTEEVMGTVVSITLYPGDLGPSAAGRALREACSSLHAADATFSTWNPSSPLSRLRRGEVTLAECPVEVAAVLDLCREAKGLSMGWFDPWSMPGGVDPTGLVKGWAAARAAQTLEAAGARAGLVNAAGDLVGFGSPAPDAPWRVGIRHPWLIEALAAVVELEAAIATSGSYERGPHLLDPYTHQPAGRTMSGTVTGPDLALADSLATALAVAGEEVLEMIERLDNYEAYLIAPDGSERSTSGMRFCPPFRT